MCARLWQPCRRGGMGAALTSATRTARAPPTWPCTAKTLPACMSRMRQVPPWHGQLFMRPRHTFMLLAPGHMDSGVLFSGCPYGVEG